jgi:predicted nucleic acid-binding protein
LSEFSSVILKAIEATQQYRMSFWDAQIWAVAVSNRIPEIFTEDGPVQQTIEGVTWRNPFA